MKYAKFGGHFENKDGAISNFTKKWKHPVFNIRYIQVSKNARLTATSHEITL